MKIMTLNKIKTVYELSQFDKLCDRAKKYLFDWLLSDNESCDCISCIYDFNIICPNLSAIEQIFNICFYRYIFSKLNDEYNYFEIPTKIIFSEYLFSQESINFEERKYIADFTFDLSHKSASGEYLFPKYKDVKYVIELDGHEYHSNKNQVNNDYKREQDLQELGYRVIRFTGSQIYNEPYTCVEKLIKIIMKDIAERSK